MKAKRLIPAITMMLVIGPPTMAQDGEAPPSLDQLLDIESAEAAESVAPPPPTSEDPTRQVVELMAQASSRLKRQRDAGLATQRLQESVIDKLDQLIRAQQPPPGGGESSSSQPSEQSDQPSKPRPSQAEQQAEQQGGQVGDGNEAGRSESASGRQGETLFRDNRTQWGNLPPRVRGELVEGTSERFNPMYRELTEAYYQKLAEQEP